MLVPWQQNPHKALRSPGFSMMSNQEGEEESCVPKAEVTSVAVCVLELQEELVQELVEDRHAQVVGEDRDQDEGEGEVENARDLRNRKKV
jgi:hypothetical protein